MNVLLVSQCDKRALKETRRVIDQFAERRGARTWQTAITQAGLDTLRGMLRRTARKNTAVACHWIRGTDQTELVWIVGDARRFNSVGGTPTNTTSRDVLRSQDEHPWIHGEAIKLLAVMAALFHDFGKASDAFQEKLRASRPIADPYRHEWVSLKLFQAFVDGREDRTWLEELADPASTLSIPDGTLATTHAFKGLGPIAQAIGWLVLSHHRLPTKEDASFASLSHLPNAIEQAWSYPRRDATEAEKRKCLVFGHGIPFGSVEWRRRAAKVARELLACPDLHSDESPPLIHDPYAMALARLSLIVADHHYSSLPSHPKYGDGDYPLFANTDLATGQCKQRLDEHLVGVASHARRVSRALLHLDRDLPRIARHRGFKRRSRDERFRWQDKAFDLASSLASSSQARGFFGVNMASTGCGKTLANGRILYGLSDPTRGTRFTVALGLRTLTLQTGDAYRSRLGLGEEDLAVVIGSAAVRDLHEAAKTVQPRGDAPALRVPGSESAEPLFDDLGYVHFSGSLEDGPLSRWLGGDGRDDRVSKLVQAPILTCTIDHLMPACEATRGGRHVGPLLRLMTSDLVLDEPDDFDLADLPALARLVFTAGMVGSRVLLSSATLAPSLVRGLFEAYARGRAHFQRHQRSSERDTRIPCAWFDELGVAHAHATVETFAASHEAFARRRATKLSALPQRRHMDVLPFPVLPRAKGHREDRARACAALVAELPAAIQRMHEQNHAVNDTGKRVSFGLVRIANVDPLIDVSMGLRETGLGEGCHLRVLTYHSRFPLLVRSATERLLDHVLQRQHPQRALTHPAVRKACAETDCDDVVFLVMASPVAEVGRDHDYDWAIVEPSSMRSLIQLVGRIRRHRPEAYDATNVLVLERNLWAAARKAPAYVRPGFESDTARFAHSSVLDLLRAEEREHLDSTARIVEHSPLSPRERLSDLEHLRTAQVFLPRRDSPWDARLAWTTSAHLVGLVQRHPRFRASRQQATFAWRLDDDGELGFFRREQAHGRRWGVEWTPQGQLVSTMTVRDAPGVAAWGATSYAEALEDTAKLLERDDLARVAERYGTVELDEDEIQQGWLFHDTLGFRRRQDTGGLP